MGVLKGAFVNESRDDFPPSVRNAIAHRAGYRCSKPDCRALTAGPSNEGPQARTNVGVAAHITAAAPGGPRYDPSLSPEERSSASNGVWLCQTHSKESDDDSIHFTVAVLRAWKAQAEEDARELVGKPISTHTLNVSLEMMLHRDADDALIATGPTNLPDGTKLMVSLWPLSTPGLLGQAKTAVYNGMFVAGGFTNKGQPHEHAWYGVEVLAYFNTPWEQIDSVLAIVGTEGKFLAGPFVEAVHPEFLNSERRVHAVFQCLPPPPKDYPQLTEEDVSLGTEIVKNAILEVEGRKSAEPVANVVDYFMTTPGLRPRDGWTAKILPNGSISVTFSFWNGRDPAVAEWNVVLQSREVRYMNIHAKYMSWMPDY
jgi:hypothetical protein